MVEKIDRKNTVDGSQEWSFPSVKPVSGIGGSGVLGQPLLLQSDLEASLGY